MMCVFLSSLGIIVRRRERSGDRGRNVYILENTVYLSFDDCSMSGPVLFAE